MRTQTPNQTLDQTADRIRRSGWADDPPHISFAVRRHDALLWEAWELGMLADVVQSNFPDGVKLPDCLRTVCDYLDARGYPISGCFEICDWGRKDAASWFRNDPAAQRQVAIFGRGSTGSSYALWLVPSANPDEAPIVLFGSEGEFTVLASNAFEFCRLLGLGYDEVESDDLTALPAAWKETAGLRGWLAERFPIDFPATGEQIARAARERHPDFGEWMRRWRAAHL